MSFLLNAGCHGCGGAVCSRQEEEPDTSHEITPIMRKRKPSHQLLLRNRKMSRKDET